MCPADYQHQDSADDPDGSENREGSRKTAHAVLHRSKNNRSECAYCKSGCDQSARTRSMESCRSHIISYCINVCIEECPEETPAGKAQIDQPEGHVASDEE